MGYAARRLRSRREADRRLSELMTNQRMLLVVHYSCESFLDREDGRSPRVTSIAVRNIGTGQTHSFSLHMVAERDGVDSTGIGDHLDEFERILLADFFDYANRHASFNWVHWNMRDVGFGFPALEHRFRVLGGQPGIVPEERRFDLASLLIDLYSSDYIGHPRLYKLLAKNSVTPTHLLSGADEASAYTDGRFVALHYSTLAKIEALHAILAKAWTGRLKHDASKAAQYGTTIGGWLEEGTDHWTFRLFGLIGIVASIVGVIALFR